MSTLVIFISVLLGGWIFPWWWPAVVCSLVGFWRPKSFSRATFAGFVGTSLGWLVPTLFQDIQNQHILSKKIALLFHLPSYLGVHVVTLLIGGLLGALAAWAGFALRQKLRPQ